MITAFDEKLKILKAVLDEQLALFREEDHPRAKNGQFARKGEGGSGGGSNKAAKKKSEATSIKQTGGNSSNAGVTQAKKQTGKQESKLPTKPLDQAKVWRGIVEGISVGDYYKSLKEGDRKKQTEEGIRLIDLCEDKQQLENLINKKGLNAAKLHLMKLVKPFKEEGLNLYEKTIKGNTYPEYQEDTRHSRFVGGVVAQVRESVEDIKNRIWREKIKKDKEKEAAANKEENKPQQTETQKQESTNQSKNETTNKIKVDTEKGKKQLTDNKFLNKLLNEKGVDGAIEHIKSMAAGNPELTNEAKKASDLIESVREKFNRKQANAEKKAQRKAQMEAEAEKRREERNKVLAEQNAEFKKFYKEKLGNKSLEELTEKDQKELDKLLEEKIQPSLFSPSIKIRDNKGDLIIEQDTARYYATQFLNDMKKESWLESGLKDRLNIVTEEVETEGRQAFIEETTDKINEYSRAIKKTEYRLKYLESQSQDHENFMRVYQDWKSDKGRLKDLKAAHSTASTLLKELKEGKTKLSKYTQDAAIEAPKKKRNMFNDGTKVRLATPEEEEKIKKFYEGLRNTTSNSGLTASTDANINQSKLEELRKMIDKDKLLALKELVQMLEGEATTPEATADKDEDSDNDLDLLDEEGKEETEDAGMEEAEKLDFEDSEEEDKEEAEDADTDEPLIDLKDDEDKKEKKSEDELPSKIFKMLADRDSLVKKVKPIIGNFDFQKMTVEQVAKYACDKLDIETSNPREAINGYLKGYKRSSTYSLDSGIKEQSTTQSQIEAYLKGSK